MFPTRPRFVRALVLVAVMTASGLEVWMRSSVARDFMVASDTEPRGCMLYDEQHR